MLLETNICRLEDIIFNDVFVVNSVKLDVEWIVLEFYAGFKKFWVL